MYCMRLRFASGEISSTWFPVNVRLCSRSRPDSGEMSETSLLGSSNSIKRLQCSKPVRSRIPLLRALIVEICATSSAVIGSSVSRFSKTYRRTASSRFLSGKICAATGPARPATARAAARTNTLRMPLSARD